MGQLTDEIKEMIKNAEVCLLSTVSDDGSPWTIPVAFKKVLSDDEAMLVNNFMESTVANLRARPDKLSLTVWATGVVSHLKGSFRIEDSGHEYEQGVEMVKAKRPELTPKSVLIFKITSVQTWHRPAF